MTNAYIYTLFTREGCTPNILSVRVNHQVVDVDLSRDARRKGDEEDDQEIAPHIFCVGAKHQEHGGGQEEEKEEQNRNKINI